MLLAGVASAAPGSSWKIQPTVPPAHGQAKWLGISGTSPSDVWVVGFSGARATAEHFDGTAWTVVNPPSSGASAAYLSAVSDIGPGDVWAVGNYPSGQVLLHGDGATWTATPVPGGNNQPQGVLAFSDRNVWVVGSRADAHNIEHPSAEHYDGTRWTYSPLPPASASGSGPAGAILTAVSGTPSDLWAVGSVSQSNLTMHYDGSRWASVQAPSPGNYDNVLRGVTALGPSDVWAVGLASYARPGVGFVGGLMIEHYDGTSWKLNQAPFDRSRTTDLAAISRDPAEGLWAVGSATSSRSSSTTALIEHYDGHAWTAVPTPNPGGTDTELDAVAAVGPGAWAAGQASNLPAGLVLRNG